MQCSAALLDGGGVDWERTALCVTVFLLVMLTQTSAPLHLYLLLYLWDQLLFVSVLVAQYFLWLGASSAEVGVGCGGMSRVGHILGWLEEVARLHHSGFCLAKAVPKI